MKALFTKSVSIAALGSLVIAFGLASCDKETPTAKAEAAPEKAKAQKVEHVATPPAPAAASTPEVQVNAVGNISGAAVAPQAQEASAAKASKGSAEEAFEVVSDPQTIMVEEGSPRPQVGDKIYTFATLPEKGCGTYWVREKDGKVAQVAICRDEH